MINRHPSSQRSINKNTRNLAITAAAASASPSSPASAGVVGVAAVAVASGSASASSAFARLYGSRNWIRRINYVVKHCNAGTYESINWNGYALHTLRGMVRALESLIGSNAIATYHKITPITPLLLATYREMQRDFQSMINKRVMLRYIAPTKPKIGSPSFIRVEWTADELRYINLKSYLLDPEIINLLPVALQSDMNDIRIAKKLTKPIGSEVLNFATTARRLHSTPHTRAAHTTYSANPASCSCRKLFATEYRPTFTGGCVYTGDLNLIKHVELRQLLSYGPSYREKLRSSNALASVRNGLNDFIRYHTRHETDGVTTAALADWKRAVLSRCTAALLLHAPHTHNAAVASPSTHIPLLQQSHIVKYMKHLHKHLIMVPTDKASSNIALVCRNYYEFSLDAELNQEGKGVYSPVSETAEKILSAHRDHLTPLGLLSAGSLRLPYLYGMPKFHKLGKAAFRFIAGSAKCSTTMLSSVLSDMLGSKGITGVLRVKDLVSGDFLLPRPLRKFPSS